MRPKPTGRASTRRSRSCRRGRAIRPRAAISISTRAIWYCSCSCGRGGRRVHRRIRVPQPVSAEEGEAKADSPFVGRHSDSPPARTHNGSRTACTTSLNCSPSAAARPEPAGADGRPRQADRGLAAILAVVVSTARRPAAGDAGRAAWPCSGRRGRRRGRRSAAWPARWARGRGLPVRALHDRHDAAGLAARWVRGDRSSAGEGLLRRRR